MSRKWLPYAVAAAALVAVAGAMELYMGRVPWCTCGYVKLWHGVVQSSENSQHLTDWYTPSHVIHGIGFYWLLWLIARRAPVGVRFVAAVLVEAAWEVTENTPMVIDRYRTATAALGYTGDSVINSLSDIAMMAVGFLAARKLPPWIAIALLVALELLPLAVIRDNLTLNVWMLLWPNQALAAWQAAG